jgi:hypothetical protein
MLRETVRTVSDGEELVLSEGEAFRFAPNAGAQYMAIESRTKSAAPKPLTVRYLGFHDVPGRREYMLDAQRGVQTGRYRYTLWIELSAFSGHHARLQDGPEICYQKLLRELSDAEPQGSDGMAVTESDLTSYREAHTRPVRRGFSS